MSDFDLNKLLLNYKPKKKAKVKSYLITTEIKNDSSMARFNLDEWLHNYKPKSSKKKVEIESYLKMNELKNYKLMENVDELEPEKVYIKYIRRANMHNGDNKVIEKGGILISGGYFNNRKFIKTDNKNEWTHLKLKTDISKKDGHIQKFHYYYYISMENYVIFYEDCTDDDVKYMVELLGRI